MISWHKPGQKVTPISDGRWTVVDQDGTSSFNGRTPAAGEVLTIAAVYDIAGFVGFDLAELPTDGYWHAGDFRPVYPTIIDQLRHLDAPVPSDRVEGGSDFERVKEGV